MPSRTNSIPAICRRAFTLLEVLAVLVVIAILVSFGFGAARRASEAGRIARARAELQLLSTALDSYRRMFGDYPHTENSAYFLQALIGRRGPKLDAASKQAFIELSRLDISGQKDPLNDPSAELLDPWGNAYRYAYRTVTPWTNPGYLLYSAGPDGQVGDGIFAGGFMNKTAPGNIDNLYAEP